MNIKKITQRGSLALVVGAAALACASTSQAVTYDFTPLDPYIEVGETFDVEFRATFDSSLEVAFFAFDVDPFASLIANGIIEFTDWSVPTTLSEFSFGPPEVGALGDPFDPLFGGTDVLLATLNFTALSAGSEVVSISGLSNLGQGLELYDFDSDSSEVHDLDTIFSVEVNAVPDASVYGFFPLLLLGMVAARRKLGTERN